MNAGATKEGTARYAARFAGKVAVGHFREWNGLRVGSIGFGTYLGAHDESTDDLYREAIVQAVRLGCNHIDTAINYRCMHSEKVVGAALAELFESSGAEREEIIVATKGGYIPFDGSPPANVRSYIRENFIERGLVDEKELAGGSHALSPSFLSAQIEKSLENLGLSHVDIYYLHNPEVHTAAVPSRIFLHRIKKAFELLETRVAEGKIGAYGISSWEAFRVAFDARPYISLEDLVLAAREVGGESHHFTTVQIPFNPAMAEGFALPCQKVGGKTMSSFDAAAALGLDVVTSVPLLQARLLKGFPPFLVTGMATLGSNAERAIQFCRSVPGVTTVLVGMSDPMHVAENMGVAHRKPLSDKELLALFA